MPRRLAGSFLLYVSVVAALLRLTVRDRVVWLAPVYYATPLPVIAACLLLAAAVLRPHIARRTVGLLTAGGLLLGCAGLAIPSGYHRCRRPVGASMRVFTWNMGWGHGGWNAEVDEVAAADPDLAMLVEAGDPTEELQQLWQRTFPDHEVRFAGGGLVLIARGSLQEVHLHPLAGGTRVATAVLTIDAVSWYVVLVDVRSNPLFARGPMLSQVYALARERSDLPVIVGGDFNTPAESVWMRTFEGGFSRAFDRAGRGWGGTWPAPVPLLSLDQLWVSPAVGVSCARHGWSLLSDHLHLLTDLVTPVAAEASATRAAATEAAPTPADLPTGEPVPSACEQAAELGRFLIAVTLLAALVCLGTSARVARSSAASWRAAGLRAAGHRAASRRATTEPTSREIRSVRQTALLGMLLAALFALAGLALPLSIWRTLALLAAPA